uniref:P0650D04.14 protein n=1 Tax=Oryza sativa subsp. japonica TaxID=39947 RepID=Q5H9Y8_ORYSJ|nr:P0650D04.14 [Oryza sativa Japonica Group]
MKMMTSINSGSAVEVKKPVSSRRRQVALKMMMTPINGGGVHCPYRREHQSATAKRANGEVVDPQQRRHNRPAVQAETPVGGGEGEPAVKT